MLLSVHRNNLVLCLKRVIDVFVAFTLLVVFSPLLLLVIVLIKITSPGPTFHMQKQVGLNQRVFKMWKFRTMVPNAQEWEPALREIHKDNGPFFKVKNDPRIFPLGRFFRKYSIDEFPQLINVLKGEMSLVGPRPLFDFEVEGFEDGKAFSRFSMKPGMTCIWQVNGRSKASAEDRIRYDLEYVEKWSLGLDLDILLNTLPEVIRGHGAV